MIRLRYTPLVTVQFTHGYYQAGGSPDFALVPTPPTTALLGAYDWVARVAAGKLLLLGREDEPGVPTAPLDEPTRFVFKVLLLNPLLPAVSEVVERGPFYFSNLNAADGTPKPLLTVGPTLTKDDLLPPLAGQQLSIELEKGKFKLLTLSSLTLNAGMQVVQSQPLAPAQQTAEVRVAQPGRYTLTKVPTDGSASVSTELYLSDELAAGPPFFGVLELTLNQTPAAPLAYTVAMACRKKMWRYFLVDSQLKHVPVEVDGTGHPNLKLVYTPPNPADPAFPGALSADTPIDTDATLSAQALALEQSAADPARPPAQRQADLAQLQRVRADLGLMQTLRTDHRVKAVYLARLPDALPVLQYAAPRLSLQRPGTPDVALPVPGADTPNATIFYTF